MSDYQFAMERECATYPVHYSGPNELTPSATHLGKSDPGHIAVVLHDDHGDTVGAGQVSHLMYSQDVRHGVSGEMGNVQDSARVYTHPHEESCVNHGVCYGTAFADRSSHVPVPAAMVELSPHDTASGPPYGDSDEFAFAPNGTWSMFYLMGYLYLG